MQKNSLLLAVLAAILCCLSSTNAQNLVPNNSFEVQDTCPAVSQITLARPWNSPTLGSPDLFNSSCSRQNSPARTGVGSSGVYCYSTFPNNREYMQAPLNSALVAGQTYCVSFYVKRTPFRYATNRIGAYFSVNAVNQTNTTSTLNFVPQVDNPRTTMLTSSNSWTQISGSFVATGGERYILIGNFHNDANSDTLVATSTHASKVAYYSIDDVSVIACTPTAVTDFQDAEKTISIYPSPVSDVLKLQLDADIKISNAAIIDIYGRKLLDRPMSINSSGVYPIDLNDVPNGVYMVSLQTSYGNVVKKIVVSK